MLKYFTILLSALCLCGPALAQESAPDAPESPQRPQADVMVLGVFHFANPGLDVVNVEAGDVLSPEGQAEMRALTEALAEWGPTKIMVEDTPEETEELNALYQAYLNGEHELTHNETQQIGFRLAMKMGHDRLYAIDSRGHPFDFPGMMEAANEAGQAELVDYLNGQLEALQASRGEDWGQRPFLDRLIEFNVPEEIDQDHAVYLDMAEAGTADNPKGAELAKQWWGRNLYIYSHMARLAEEGDRILVIFGQGHAYTLRGFIEHSRRFELVEPNPYLKKAQD